MEFNLAKENMKLLIEEIIDAVESNEDRDEQFDAVQTVLIDNGIVTLKEMEFITTDFSHENMAKLIGKKIGFNFIDAKDISHAIDNGHITIYEDKFVFKF